MTTFPVAVLVTGSAGFIGRHLVRQLLDRGVQVTGVDARPSGLEHPRYAEHVADLREPEPIRRILAAAAPDAVLHLAARTDLDETRDLSGYAVNIDGVAHLVAAIREVPSVRRWVCTSTQLVCRIGYTPTSDTDYQPSTLYGESKVRTEQIVRDADGAGRTWTLVRPTTIWGPGMSAHYARFFGMIRDGRYFHVGPRPTYKSYGYVENTAHQYVRLLEAPVEAVHRRTFYLADYEPIALEEWADAFQRELGAPRIRVLPLAVGRVAARIGDVITRLGVKRFPFTSFRLRNVRTPYQVDTSATRAVCGPLPFTEAQGVAATAAWLRTLWRGTTA